jgi:MSHA pilin protein MshB
MKMREMQGKQKGFTIIELVVVILLLGILTATALPRFMDVTDEAHDAVVEAVLGGLGTGVALFKSEWYGTDQPNTVGGEWNMVAYRVSGYPMGGTLGTIPNSMRNSADCVALFTGLLQPAGRPSITSKPAAAGALSTVFQAIGSTADFVAYLDSTSSTTGKACRFAYTGQFASSSLGGVPVIIYDASTGSVTMGAEL